MCRNTLSVGWDGVLYDCDFNQMLDMPVEPGVPRHIADFDLAALDARSIVVDRHCFGCNRRRRVELFGHHRRVGRGARCGRTASSAAGRSCRLHGVFPAARGFPRTTFLRLARRMRPAGWSDADVPSNEESRGARGPPGFEACSPAAGAPAARVLARKASPAAPLAAQPTLPDSAPLYGADSYAMMTFRGNCSWASRNVNLSASPSAVGCTLPLTSVTRETTVCSPGVAPSQR